MESQSQAPDNTEAAFDLYLIKKKIDAKAFAAGVPSLYAIWYACWSTHHVFSFETRYKFQLNPIRRRYKWSA